MAFNGVVSKMFSDYVITHGFSKKTNKTPQREIDHAIDLRAEFYQTYKDEDDK